MASSCRLRPASHADLPALVDLERDAFSDPWTDEQLRAALAWPGVVAIVAHEDTALIGYVLGRVIVDQAEILSLATAAQYRRRGIGRELLNEAIATMASRGARSAWLEVRESNAAARAMYHAAGFIAAGRRRDYYRQPVEDALILRREFRAGERVKPT